MTPEGELQCVGGVSLPLECLSGREDDSREENKHRLLLEAVLADVKLSDFGAPSDTGSQFHNSLRRKM